MMAMGAARVVFTTNFDEVVETAFAEIAGKPLMAFSLDGSYAAVDALNKDSFPLYAKLHGDFRFRNLKNLTDDLRNNDAAIGKAFLTAASRFGAVVSGYSGRDENVLRLFKEALNQPNPFPSGLFWTAARMADVSPSVLNLIDAARAKNIKSSVVEVGTFDILMNKLWRQLLKRPPDLIAKVRPDHAAKVAITVPPPGNSYPMLRTNALPIVELPNSCGRFVCDPQMSYERLRAAQGDKIPDAAVVVTDAVLYWGASNEVESFIPPKEIRARDSFHFDDPRAAIVASTIVKSLFEHALAKALCAKAPINLRYRHGTYYAVANPRAPNANLLERLASAVAGHRSAPLSGMIPKANVRWAEAVSIRLGERNGGVYLMLDPTIWITPSSERERAGDFIRARVLKRYNPQANSVFDAWIGILLGEPNLGEAKVITAFAGDDYPASFTVNSRSAFSRREQRHAD
jgi:hypothetical protein